MEVSKPRKVDSTTQRNACSLPNEIHEKEANFWLGFLFPFGASPDQYVALNIKNKAVKICW